MAIVILCRSKSTVSQIDDANTLLRTFVDLCRRIMGQDFVTLNVHLLVHLSDCRKKFGCLDSFSAFQFENFMREIKKKVFAPNRPLQQIMKRLESNLCNQSNKFQLLRPHVGGTIISPGKEYNKLVLDQSTFVVNDRDSHIVTNENKFFKILNIVQSNSIVHFVCNEYTSVCSLFSYPINSSNLGIHKISCLHEALCLVPLSKVKSKCVVFKLDEVFFACFPFCHLS